MNFGSTLRRWLALAAIGLLAGCGSDGGSDGGGEAPVAAAAPGIATVDSGGGSALGPDGATIVIAPGSLARPTTITIARDSNDAPARPQGVAPAGSVYAITPHGTVFSAPATVRLPFDRALLAAGERVALLKADVNGSWRLITDVTVEGDQLVAQVSSLSYFLPIRLTPPIDFGTITGPTEAQFALDLDNTGYAPLTAAPGAGIRLWQQPAPGQVPALRVTYVVPATASLLAHPMCSASFGVSLRLEYRAVTVYRVPGESGSRVLRDHAFLDDRFDLLDAARYGRSLTYTTAFSPVAHRYRLEDRPPAPPGTIDDGGAFQVELVVACGNLTLPSPTSPIVITPGYPDVDTYILTPPQPVVAQEGANIVVPAVTIATTPDRPEWARKWEISDTSGSNFVEVPRGLSGEIADRLSLNPGVYGFYFDHIEGTVIGRSRPADTGRQLRAVVCTSSSSFPGTNVECVTSPPARLTVTAVPPVPPRFNVQPASATYEAGQWLQIVAGWESAPAPGGVVWQWRANAGAPWQTVDPAMFSVLTVPGTASEWLGTTRVAMVGRALTLADDGVQFRATFTTSAGTATSDPATVSVTPALVAPGFTVQPADSTLANGRALQLYARVNGSTPLSYQWLKDGVPITGANGQALVVDPANTTNGGNYALEVSNRAGTVRSRTARVTVTPVGTPDIGPLAVARQPQPTSVGAGGTAAFVASFSGNPATYQWTRNGVAIPGETGPALVISNVTSADEGDYSLLASNVLGSLRSESARLSVVTGTTPSTPPAIATQPVGLAVIAGQTATFAVATSGSGPLAYQWRLNGKPLPGAVGAVLTIADVQGVDAGNYSVVVSNGAGSVTSSVAGLVVTPVPGAPTITVQPTGRTGTAGQPVSFAMVVTGNPAPTCLWMRNGIAIAGATSCSGLTLTSASLADNGAVYSVVVVNSGGFVLSNPAVLTVVASVPPAFTIQPTAQAWGRGAVTFTVGASGTPAPTIDWAVDRERIGRSGRYELGGCTFDYTASGSTLTLTGVAEACIGSTFMAIATNEAGRVESTAAELIAPGGFATRLAGLPGTAGSVDGTADSARFNTPNYLMLASDGRIAVGDFGNSTLRLVAANGDVSTLAGSPGVFGYADGTGPAARFNGSGGLAYDGAGNLFVSDWDNHVIRRVTPAGVVTTFAGTPGAAGSADGSGAAARFRNPNGLAIDGAGNLYVVDWGNHTIRKITPAGAVSTLAGTAGLPGSADGAGPAARFNTPGAIAIDGSGTLYVTDMFNHTVRKITPAGAVSTLAGLAGVPGTADGTGGAARFDVPAWIAATADGTLFVVSAAGDTVRRVSAGGVVQTVVGVLGDSSVLRLGSDPRLRNARGVWAVSANELLLNADQAVIRVHLP